MRFFKCTRTDGTDHKTGQVDYGAALESGAPIEVSDAHSAEEAEKHRSSGETVCGHGLHVSPTARKTIQFANHSHRPWRWFEVEVAKKDIIESDEQKSRVRRLKVVKEITLSDIFGADFSQRIADVQADAKSWKTIPWLKPPAPVSEAQLRKLFGQWLAAIKPWLAKVKKLPTKMRVVRTAAAAAAAADAAADAAAAAAAADADADAAAAAAADADAAAADAAADADAAAAAAAADAFRWRYWHRWYVRPCYVLRRFARWKLAGMEQPNIWAPLVEMYLLGALPIGFVKDEFVIYLSQKAE